MSLKSQFPITKNFKRMYSSKECFRQYDEKVTTNMRLDRRNITVNKTDHDISEIIQLGDASNIYRVNGGIIKEFMVKGRVERSSFEHEIYWLQHFSDTGITPKVKGYDAESLTILLEDCGEPISKDNLPGDWEIQIDHILAVLDASNCRHNDLSDEELLVKNNKITIVDFAAASLGKDMTCGGIDWNKSKKRVFSDRYIKNLVDLKLAPSDGSSEMHNFILWDTSEEDLVEQKIGESFKIVQKISYNLSAIKQIGPSRLEFLYKIYHGRVSNHGSKAKEPFTVFVVIDQQPNYEERANVFTGAKSVVNTNMFDLLQELRKGRNSYLHGSDCTQESYDNLETLTMYDKQVPLTYWHSWRPKFASIPEFFDRLNNTVGLKYVVMRNFETLLEGKTPGTGEDIDLLVNDFYLFKQISGAIGYKHKQSTSYVNGGATKEYGGYKVGAHVMIDGRKVYLDIRYVGDDYYVENWQEDLLNSAVSQNGVNIPSDVNHFYSLLYHALVHKNKVNYKYRSTLSEMAINYADEYAGEKLADDQLWSLLNKFMATENYSYVRPLEHSIPFKARAMAGIDPNDDLMLVNERINSQKFREARHLINQLRNDYPLNIKYVFYSFKNRFLLFINELAGGNIKLRKMVIREKIKDKKKASKAQQSF